MGGMLNPIAALRHLVLPRWPTAPTAPRPAFQALLRRREPRDTPPTTCVAPEPTPAPLPGGPGAPEAPAPLPSGSPPAPPAALAALQELWPLLVRRVAWEGDGRRACMRLELGAGALSGATVLLTYDQGRVRVAIDHPTHGDLDAWRARIGARLVAAGLPVAEVE